MAGADFNSIVKAVEVNKHRAVIAMGEGDESALLGGLVKKLDDPFIVRRMARGYALEVDLGFHGLRFLGYWS